MKASLFFACLLVTALTTPTTAKAFDLVTSPKDKVLATLVISQAGNGEVTIKTDKTFFVKKNSSLSKLDLSSISDLTIREDAQKDLAESNYTKNISTPKAQDSLFYKKLNIVSAIDTLESAAIRQVINDTVALNQISKLKYKIKISKFEVGNSFDCKLKRLEKVCSGPYTVETILNVVE